MVLPQMNGQQMMVVNPQTVQMQVGEKATFTCRAVLCNKDHGCGKTFSLDHKSKKFKGLKVCI